MTRKNKVIMKAVVLLIASVLTTVSCSAVSFNQDVIRDIEDSDTATLDWIIEAEDVQVDPGDTGVEIEVIGEYAEDIGAYSVAGYYDKTKLTVTDINFTDSVGEGAAILMATIDEAYGQAFFHFGMLYDITPPIDSVPAGSGILATITVDVAADAGDCNTFIDIVDNTSNIGLAYQSHYSNASGYSKDAELLDGTVTIGNPNNPPNAPVNQGPADGTIDISVNPTLSVTVSDPDSDSMDVSFYVDDILESTVTDVTSGDTASVLIADPLAYGTTYDWYVIADDGEDTTQSATWTFTTINAYTLTVNIDGSGSVDLDPAGGIYEDDTPVELTALPDSGWEFSGWSGDLSGDTNPETLLMDADKTVTATFEELPKIPDLDGSGDLSWTDVEPAGTVTETITIANVGDPKSLLDWEIESYPEWGTWTFDPETGTDLTPEDGEFAIDVSVVAPNEEETEFTGTVKVVNSEDSSDYIELDVSLATPVVKNSLQNLFLQLVQFIGERFPLLEQMLSNLIR